MSLAAKPIKKTTKKVKAPPKPKQYTVRFITAEVDLEYGGDSFNEMIQEHDENVVTVIVNTASGPAEAAHKALTAFREKFPTRMLSLMFVETDPSREIIYLP